MHRTSQWKENFGQVLASPNHWVEYPDYITGEFLKGNWYLGEHRAWRATRWMLNSTVQYYASPHEADPDADVRLMDSYGVTGHEPHQVRGPFLYYTPEGGPEVSQDTSDKVYRMVARLMNCTRPSCLDGERGVTPFLKFRGPERTALLCRLSEYGNASWLAVTLQDALGEAENSDLREASVNVKLHKWC